jgi:hypothetical protein
MPIVFGRRSANFPPSFGCVYVKRCTNPRVMRAGGRHESDDVLPIDGVAGERVVEHPSIKQPIVVQEGGAMRATESAAFSRRMCDVFSNLPGTEAIGGRLGPLRDVGVPHVIVEAKGTSAHIADRYVDRCTWSKSTRPQSFPSMS